MSGVVYDLDAAAFSSDEFRMYQFKVGPIKHTLEVSLNRPIVITRLHLACMALDASSY